MAPTTPLEIKVVYDSSKRRRRASYRRVGPSHGQRMWPLLLLGVFNVVVSGALYYGTWWQADPFIYLTFMMKTPTGIPPDAVSKMFGISVDTQPAQRQAEPADPPTEGPSWAGRKAQVAIPLTGYSWLTISTTAVFALSLAGGAALGRGRARMWRRLAMLLGIAVVLGLAFAFFKVGRQYTPTHLRIGMGCLTFLALMIGLSMGRGVRGLTRLAGILLILSAIGTAVGLYVGGQCGATEPAWATPAFLALALAVHSLWGWVLLVVAGRVRS
jgi:hypothetical protein